MYLFYSGISAEPLGHGSKIEVTKLPRFKKELRFATVNNYMHIYIELGKWERAHLVLQLHFSMYMHMHVHVYGTCNHVPPYV